METGELTQDIEMQNLGREELEERLKAASDELSPKIGEYEELVSREWYDEVKAKRLDDEIKALRKAIASIHDQIDIRNAHVTRDHMLERLRDLVVEMDLLHVQLAEKKEVYLSVVERLGKVYGELAQGYREAMQAQKILPSEDHTLIPRVRLKDPSGLEISLYDIHKVYRQKPLIGV